WRIQANREPGGEQPPAGNVSSKGVRRCRRSYVLRSEPARPVPTSRHVCGQNPQRGQAGGLARGATDQVRIGHQPEDCKRTGADDHSRLSLGRRRGDRMSNCVVGSGGPRLPCSTIAEHSVEGCDHFSHDGDDDDLGFFVGGGEAFVKGLEGGTVTACAEGGHVEDVTDRHPTTIDAAVSLELAAVEVIWCEADEGGDLFAAHLPEFWQQGDERE